MVRSLCICAAFLVAGCSERGDGGGGTGGETSIDACSDGRDNDGDGLSDCDEPACRAYAFCSGGIDGGPGGVDGGTVVRPDTGPPRDGGSVFCTEPLDVVFVIDVSSSMADEIEQIRNGVDSIWGAAQALTADTQFMLVVFVDDVLAINSCGPFASREAMQTELSRWHSFTGANNQPGGSPYTNSDCPENSIDALYLAASACPWRPGATHIVVHVTDDTFAERPATLSGFGFPGSGIAVAHTYAEAVAALQEHEVRVGTFAAPMAEFCGADTSGNTAQGFFDPYMGMPSIPEATGGQAWSIRDVRMGTLDMAEAISAFTEAEYCTLY